MLRLAVAFAALGAGAVAAPLAAPVIADCRGKTIELVVDVADITYEGVLTHTVRAFHYEGVAMAPGPTILMKAGTWCRIRVINNLMDDGCVMEERFNEFRCPNTTNLHTHGLHISSAEDDMRLAIRGGTVHEYVYNVPANHMMGSFWYHAHFHGSITLQLGAGMAGGLIVEAANPAVELPADLLAMYDDAIPPLVITMTIYGPPSVAQPYLAQFFDFSVLEGVYNEADQSKGIPTNRQLAPGSPGPEQVYVNAQYQPSIDIYAEHASVFRFIHATGVQWVALSLNDSSCYMTVIARDGIFQYTPYMRVAAVAMSSGSRADIAIYCAADVAGKTVNVKSDIDVPYTFGTLNSAVQSTVFTINVRARPAGVDARPVPVQEAVFPSYLTSLMSSGTMVKVGGERGTKKIFMGHYADNHSSINGKFFAPWSTEAHDDLYLDDYCLGTVYEMYLFQEDLINPTAATLSNYIPHPYHQHTHPFQIVEQHGDLNGNVIRRGEWRDTVPDFNVTVRFRPLDFDGHMLMHCHTSAHADRGMVAAFHVSRCPSTGSAASTDDDDELPTGAVVALSLIPFILLLIAVFIYCLFCKKASHDQIHTENKNEPSKV
ncbi:Multicopper oxidase mco [Diplonema papillatum]|nr:Multicopper oxidase mco [Diplonema papillatum]